MIMGEVAGTHIIGSTNEQSMFRIQKGQDLFTKGNYGGIDYYYDQAVDVNGFYNIILSDNMDGYSLDAFTAPKATMSTVPMIVCERGSNLFCERVTFLGRISNTNPPLVTTMRAIGYDALTASGGASTSLKCVDCYFDGMANAVFFDTTEGKLDSLRIEKCRARTGAASIANATLYSFAASNLANIHLEGNYHIGDVTFGAKGFFNITSTAVTDSDVRVVIIGNKGGLSSASSNELLLFFKNDSTATYEGTITGNSWGAHYDNPWFIIVGDGTNSVGDITGTGAIDIALKRSVLDTLDSSPRDTTVIVGYGTYSVTDTTLSSTASYVNLYGLSRNGKLPELQLNASTDTDAASNPTIMLGPFVENINFTAVAAYHTITLTYSTASGRDAFSYVRNCNFTDVGVFYPSIARATTDKI
jgi:hypothetical protein